jgi:hypothetical protein
LRLENDQPLILIELLRMFSLELGCSALWNYLGGLTQLKMTDFQQKLWLAFWGALAGGVVSLVINVLMPRVQRWNQTRNTSIEPEQRHNDHIRFRLTNGGYWTMADAILYLQLDFEEEDVLQPPEGQSADIIPGHFAPLNFDQLCWSVRDSSGRNPMRVSIFAKEAQPFASCQIRTDCIIIPTELGWGTNQFRVFLRPRDYFGHLRVVSADTNGRTFRVRITPQQCTIE